MDGRFFKCVQELRFFFDGVDVGGRSEHITLLLTYFGRDVYMKTLARNPEQCLLATYRQKNSSLQIHFS